MAITRLIRNPILTLIGLGTVCLIALSGCEDSNDPAFGTGGYYAAGASGTVQGTGGTVQGTGGAVQGTGGAIQGTGGAVQGTGGAVQGTGGAVDGAGGTVDGAGGTTDGTGGAADGGGGTTDGTGGATDGGGGTGGTTDGGAGTGDDYSPLCNTLTTDEGVNPAKGGVCIETDPQLCYKGCGPETSKGVGFKSETCIEGSYAEGDCVFPADADYSCYAIPDTIDATCPAETPQATQPCDVAYCVICNVGGNYLTSSGESKTGYCVCPEGATDRKWSCASTDAWPCPAGQGCGSI